MDKTKHIIIFSHGFGVKKDDRGLLSDVAGAFPDSSSYLFDYFNVDEENMTLTTCTFTKQASMLKDVFNKVKKDHPDAVMDIIAHSQGSLIPALAKLEGVRRTILLAPVLEMDIERTVARHASDPESIINFEGMSQLRRLDGYLRYVPKEYWEERRLIEPINLYNEYVLKNELIIINANQDSILGNVDMSRLNSSIRVINLDGDHGFSGESRKNMIRVLKEEIER